MSDLKPDVRRLVDLTRRARTPGDDAKRRVAARIAGPLATGAVIATGAGVAKAGTAGKAASATLFGAWSVKLSGALAVGALATAALVGSFEAEPGPKLSPSMQPLERKGPEPLPSPPASAAPQVHEREREPAAPKASSASRSPKPSHELAEEATLLHEAQAAWRAGQSARSLTLANQHAERFPRSQLANERDVLRTLSLCKLGHEASAKQVGARLLKTAKGSPWYQSVAASCAAD